MNRRKFLQILGVSPIAAVFPALAGKKEKELCAGATLVQGPEMTATEVLARMKEHAQLFEMTW